MSSENNTNVSISNYDPCDTDWTSESYTIFKNVIGYTNFALVIIGVVSNILSIIVFRKNPSSTAIYFTALAVADILTLLSDGIDNILGNLYKNTYLRMGEIVCKTYAFISFSSTSVASFLVLVVTIERVISVIFPFRAKTLCSVKFAKSYVVVLWLVIFGIQCHFLFNLKDVNGFCNILYHEFVSWLNVSLTFAVPFVGIATGNIMIIYKLAINAKRRRDMTSSKSGSDNSSLTITLLMVSAAFLATMSPVTLYLVIVAEKLKTDICFGNSKSFTVIVRVLLTLANSNAVLNFFLYLVSGQKFRQDLKILFGFCGRDSSSHSSSARTKTTKVISTDPKSIYTVEDGKSN